MRGLYNGSSKNVGLGKFWPNLKISEVFVIGLVLGVSMKPESHSLAKSRIYHSTPLMSGLPT